MKVSTHSWTLKLKRTQTARFFERLKLNKNLLVLKISDGNDSQLLPQVTDMFWWGQYLPGLCLLKSSWRLKTGLVRQTFVVVWVFVTPGFYFFLITDHFHVHGSYSWSCTLFWCPQRTCFCLLCTNLGICPHAQHLIYWNTLCKWREADLYQFFNNYNLTMWF